MITAGNAERDGLEAAVDFAHDRAFAVGELDLGGEGRLRPSEHLGQHLADLIRVVVDRLLAHQDQLRLLVLDQLLEHAREGERIERRVS